MSNYFSPKALFLLFVLFFGGFYSCCEEPTPLYFEPKRMVFSHMNNEGARPVLAMSNEVPAIAYVLQAVIKSGRILTATNIPKSPPNMQFGMSAKAEGCYPYENVNEHRLEGWDIYCLNDFDASHPAGSSVTEYFEFYSNRCIYSEMSAGDEVAQFALYATPEQNEQQFILDVYFNNGVVLRDTSSVVWLN